MVKLFRIIVPVTDIEKASKFYGTVLDMPGERISGGRHYFKCGEVILACYWPEGDNDEVKEIKPVRHPLQYIYLAVDDLETVFDRVKDTGAEITAPIETQFWGERSFYAIDPFGNPICFVDDTTLFLGGSE